MPPGRVSEWAAAGGPLRSAETKAPPGYASGTLRGPVTFPPIAPINLAPTVGPGLS